MFAELKKKFTAIPTRIIFRFDIPEQLTRNNIKNTEPHENIKEKIPAFTKANLVFAPKIIARAAPKAELEEIPKVKGEASGLPKIICITAPDKPRQEPAVIAIRISGNLIFSTI